jgi:hypothetical protein
MQSNPVIRSCLIAAVAMLAHAAVAAEPGFKSIFNGKDLTDWDGNPLFWSAQDGAIVGQSTPEKQVKPNTFLVWKGGEPANFELRGSFRLTAQNDQKFGNSGVQYRSKVLDQEKWVVGGYQMDIDFGTYVGMLYEERGRGILMKPGQTIEVGPLYKDDKGKDRPKIDVVKTQLAADDLKSAYKVNEWNDFTIIATGNHVQHFLNGQLIADVTDNDPDKAPKSGVIALQMHQGQPMTIQFKDLRLKTLP